MPVGGIVRPVHAIAVSLARLHRRQVHVPHERIDVAHLDARLLAAVAEQTQLDALGTLAEQREVRSTAVERRPERVRGSWPCLHVRLPVR
jgi:hypothetical protein